ncbi:MAG: Phosphatidate cytidylyltransferase [uncultured bacterium]|nr:MAG: Phosphatidate cytidylyltransferase [uncultured bacterium]
MLKQRVITAAILILITLAVLFYLPPPAFCVLTAFITLAAAWEWTNLAEVHSTSARLFYLAIIIFLLFGFLFIPVPLVLAAAFLWWVTALLLILFYPHVSDYWGKGVIARSLMGIFVLVPCWVALNYIRNVGNGIYVLFYLFILIWGADTVAYFVGKKWGKTKLAPVVSPGKSWQGAIGAILFSALIAVIFNLLGDVPSEIKIPIIFLSIMTVIFSIIGDLFESMLKRKINLKDSGRLLPGHGGLLDRIDSLTAASPIFALGLSMIMVLH